MQLIPENGNPQKIIISTGEYLAVNRKIVLSTILGSCVAVCLFDGVNKVMGMNHIMLSNEHYSENINCSPQKGRYGHCAMKLLLKNMKALGAKINNIKAKAFGGASINEALRARSDNYRIGKINISYVKMFLNQNKIPLIAEDLGGDYSRSISFFPKTYNVEVTKLNKFSTLKLLA